MWLHFFFFTSANRLLSLQSLCITHNFLSYVCVYVMIVVENGWANDESLQLEFMRQNKIRGKVREREIHMMASLFEWFTTVFFFPLLLINSYPAPLSHDFNVDGFVIVVGIVADFLLIPVNKMHIHIYCCCRRRRRRSSSSPPFFLLFFYS